MKYILIIFSLITLIISATIDTDWTIPSEATKVNLSNSAQKTHLTNLITSSHVGYTGCLNCEIRSCLQLQNSSLGEIFTAFKWRSENRGENYQVYLTINYNKETIPIDLVIKFHYYDGVKLKAIRKITEAGPNITSSCLQ